jgi:hypothetical protein
MRTRLTGVIRLESQNRMNLKARQTLRRQASFCLKELGLYASTATFLVLSPLVHEHWLLVLGSSWILAAIIVGRMARVIDERLGTRSIQAVAEPAPKCDPLTPVIAGVTYLALILLMWGPFAFSSGMGYETSFSYYSETSTLLSGFVDVGDPMRPFTNLFYHVSYLLGLVTGVPGSFVPFQFVYAALWWMRGLLVFLILRRLVGGYEFLCYIAGALVIVHASDGALQWVGQMNQFGYIFWMLLAVYFLLLAADQNTVAGVYARVALACACEVLCLWSYESAVPILILAPLLIMLIRPGARVKTLAASGAWYAVIGAYLYLSLQKYLHFGSSTYQASVMRSDWRPAALFNDLVFNARNSLFFWTRPDVSSLDMSPASIATLAAAAAVVVVAGGIMLARQRDRHETSNPVAPDRVLGALLGAGVLLLIASFPVYLLLSSARMLWRTQFLSGIGAAMVLASVLGLIVNRVGTNRRWLQYAGCLCAVSGIAYGGVHRAIELGCFHRAIWQQQRRVMAEIIRTVPQVKPGTLFLVCGIPRKADPFRDSMWLDLALRLSYPGTRVAGAYFYDEDDAPASGNVFRLHAGEWVREQRGFPPLIGEAEARDSVILEYRGSRVDVLPSVPSYMCSGTCDAQDYHPEERILEGKPSPRAVNRYGPIGSP